MIKEHVISRWLQLRKNILISYCSLSKISPFNEEVFYSTEEMLQQLCRMLHEYLTTSDLHIFEHIEINKATLQALAQTSLQATHFYSKYYDIPSDGIAMGQSDQLITDLNDFGEVFATRMAIEDQLIDAHRPVDAPA